ncbi:MAG: ATP-binding protein, partial [Telluria sp.]
ILMLDRMWNVVFMNRHAEIVLDRKRNGLLGKVLWDEFPEAVGSTFQREYQRCMAENVSVRFEEYFAPLKKHFEVNAYPSDDGIAVYFRDITEQRALAEQIIQAQKLESLGRLTGGVAHDFNNVLTVILGNAELLVEQSAPGSASHTLADMVLDAAQRGADMTQRLLAFARKQALEPRSVNLNRMIGGMDHLLQRTLGSHIDIEMVQSAGLWQTLVDPGQLESALLNLAINARDAMAGGGKLTIETGNVRIDDSYAAKDADIVAGQYVLLAVSDSGTGIAPELLARVFEPFFTTKQVGKGTGLGLAMVYGFVKQSKGHVAIYSEPDKGTTVKIYLPRLPGVEAQEPERSAPGPLDTGSGQLVLLVEDDAPVRTYARGQLQDLGYRVLEAGSGPEALELLEQHHDIDLLFTDVVMPGGLSGRALADAAHALRPGLPVLYTSGYTENAIVHHGRLKPGVMLLSKPYRRAELAAKVSLALAARTINTTSEIR